MKAMWRTSLAATMLFGMVLAVDRAVAEDGALPHNVLNAIAESSYTANQAEAVQSTSLFERRVAATRLGALVISALADYPRHATQILRTVNFAAPRHRNYIAKAVGQAFPGYRHLALNEANALQQAPLLLHSVNSKSMTGRQPAVLSVVRAQHVTAPEPILLEKLGLTALVIGGGGHDVGVFGRREEFGKDINFEIRFLPFSGWLWDFLHSPEPHIGVHFNTEGYTNQIFFGGTWMFDFDGKFFAGGGLSLSIHDGETETDRLDRKELGLSVLFRESAEVGYRVGQHHSISLHLDHISNAGIGIHNEGLDTFGLRYTYRI